MNRVLTCLLLSMTACTLQIEQQSKLDLQGAKEIVLDSQRLGDLFFVRVWIESQGPFEFLVDTGASTTVLDLPLAHILRKGLESDEEAFYLDEMRIGPLLLRDHLALAHGLERYERVLGRNLDGILGYAAFLDVQLIVDYPRSQLRLATSKAPLPPGARLLDLDSPRRPLVRLSVGNEPFTFLVDTGSERGMTLTAPELVRWQHELRPIALIQTFEGTRYRYEGRLAADVEFAGTKLHQPICGTSESVSTLGASLLRHFTVHLDPRAGILAVSGPREIDFPPVRGFGWSLRREGAGRRVVAVFPSTPAESAGIQEGDILLEIDGKPIPDLGRHLLEPPYPDHPVRFKLLHEGREKNVSMPPGVLIP